MEETLHPASNRYRPRFPYLLNSDESAPGNFDTFIALPESGFLRGAQIEWTIEEMIGLMDPARVLQSKWDITVFRLVDGAAEARLVASRGQAAHWLVQKVRLSRVDVLFG